MRMMALALLGTVLAGACQPAAKDGLPLAERRLAEKLVNTGLLISVDPAGLRQVAGQQAQQAVMAGYLAPDQFQQGIMAIERSMEPVMAEARESAVKGLVDTFNVKELEMLVEFFASKRGDNIRNNLGAALGPSEELIASKANEAIGKALEQLRGAWPAAPTPPAAPAIPGAPGAPVAPLPSN
mgnify:CR=1 FL=1|jgi:hypothetical protein